MGKGMRAGKKPSGPKQPDMHRQLQQMQAVQAKMEAVQAELDEREFTATAGGGAVSVTANGKREITAIAIKPDVIDPEEAEMLQDLIMVAVNEVLRQVSEVSQAEMDKITGGLGIPGL